MPVSVFLSLYLKQDYSCILFCTIDRWDNFSSNCHFMGEAYFNSTALLFDYDNCVIAIKCLYGTVHHWFPNSYYTPITIAKTYLCNHNHMVIPLYGLIPWCYKMISQVLFRSQILDHRYQIIDIVYMWKSSKTQHLEKSFFDFCKEVLLGSWTDIHYREDSIWVPLYFGHLQSRMVDKCL